MKKIVRAGGAFISPKGKIFYTYDSHEFFAHEFCFGRNYNYLNFCKYNPNSELLEEERERTDVFQTSKLTSEELELFKLWLDKARIAPGMYSDFLVRVLCWDKISALNGKRVVTTTSLSPVERFYNYCLMGYRIGIVESLIYDKDREEFVNVSRGNSIREFSEEYLKEEITNIRRRTKTADIPLYFR